MKRQPTKWETIIVKKKKSISDKGLISKIHKHNSVAKNNLMKKQRIGTDVFPKMTNGWLKGT